jgi:phosphatidylserine decarboxylase
MREHAFIAMQYLLPQHLLSRLVGRLARATWRPWKNFLIRAFLRHFRVRMDEAVEPDPFVYPSFNAFFTRALRPDVRFLAAAPAIACPVDGTVSQAGRIDGERLIQAKGRDFTLAALMAGDEHLAPTFQGGSFATIYLAPYNYHRIHMPIDGGLISTTFVPGRLFSVNAATARRVPRLFARNERITCVFETEVGLMAVILVGALFVGSMSTVWAGDVARPGRPRPKRLDAPRSPVFLRRGAELGRFNMGSTVIVMFEPERVRWNAGLAAGATVQLGEAIGTASREPT